MRACIKAGVNYLDITAEINIYRLAEELGAQAAEGERHVDARSRLGRRADGLPGCACRASFAATALAERCTSGAWLPQRVLSVKLQSHTLIN